MLDNRSYVNNYGGDRGRAARVPEGRRRRSRSSRTAVPHRAHAVALTTRADAKITAAGCMCVKTRSCDAAS